MSGLRRLGLAGGLGIITALGGLFFLPAKAALNGLTHGGYWLVLAAFVAWAWALTRELPAWWRSMVWTRADRWAAGVIAVLGTILVVHEEAGFKILMDEIHLLGTSMAMHLERAVYVPQRANDLQGIFELMAGQVDKRPLFFPLLVSLIHDLTGYRPENAFWLNTVLTYGLLGLSYLAGRALGGWRAGLFAVLGWAALPLLGQNSRGGGFELLNVTMILAVALLGAWHYRRRDAGSQTALVLGGVLLAQTRYESPLFLLPVAAVLALVWWEERAIRLAWPVVLSPVLLLPVPLLTRVFEARPASWEMASRPGYEHVFSPLHIPDNLGHAFAYWFNTGVEQPNSVFLSAVGCVGLVLAVVGAGRQLRAWSAETPAVRLTLVFGVGVGLHLLLMLCYFWGKFDDPVIRRLSLPAHLLFVFAPLLAVRQLPRPERAGTALLTAGLLAFVATGLPALAKQGATKLYYPALDTAWRRDFMAARPERDYLFIDNESTTWITHRVSATPVVQARARPEAIAFNLRNRLFSGIFVFQQFDIDEATGRLTIKADDDLGPAFELEPVAERTFRVDLLSRISRVKAVTLPGGERAEGTPILPAAPAGAGSRDAREQAFLADWLKHLP